MGANKTSGIHRIHSFDADRLQRPARGLRRLAVLVFLTIVAIPFALIYTPWQQNIVSQGRVVAFDPLDRAQTIPAPVSGRIVKVNVREGQRVRKDDLLVELADLDPFRQQRLEQQLSLVQDKLNAAEESVGFYQRQFEQIEVLRDLEVTVARFEFDQAELKVQSAEQDLNAARADLAQKEADVTRQEGLAEKGIRSELDAQKARAAYESAVAKEKAAVAKLAEGRAAVEEKRTKIDSVQRKEQAKLEKIASERENARSKVAEIQKEAQDAASKLERQRTQVVRAPRDGVILRIRGAQQADLVKSGQPLVDFVPYTRNLAVELWVKGNDAPLVEPGDPVRLNFEGWPAIQWVGWPSIAQGTFGGRVAIVDPQDDGRGNFRILVLPDPDDEDWPEPRFLRQGVRTKGWVLLQEVSLGYEIWRQLNGFPPAFEAPPGGNKGGDGKESGAAKGGDGGKK